jgi:hypothetical protein
MHVCARCRYPLSNPWVGTPWGPMHPSCAARGARQRQGLDPTAKGVAIIAACTFLLLFSVAVLSALRDASGRTRVPSRTASIGVNYAERAAITVGQRQWVVIIVPPRTSRASLIALARTLHDAREWTRFMIFDDGNEAKIAAYAAFSLHYGEPGFKERYPYDRAWLAQHQVGRINDMLGPGWSLLDASGDVIVVLE